MRLYTSPNSPYARKCLIVLHETGMLSQVELVEASGSPLDPGSVPVALAPLGKIPLLELAGAGAIYDSRVICGYLDSLSGGKLTPTGAARWQCATLEATADGILDAALLMVYEDRFRLESMRYAPWVEGQWAKIVRALDALESRWLAHLFGPLDLGQIAIAAALGYLDLRHAARDWRQGRPGLSGWHARFSERSSMQATVPPG